MAGTQLGLRLADRTTVRVGPADVSTRVSLSREPGVLLDVPPLGTARLRTHRGPLQLQARASGVDPDEAQRLLHSRHPPKPDIVPKALAVRTLAAGVGGAAALAVLATRRPRDGAVAATLAAAGLAGAAATAAATFDRDAWRDPELTGLLTRAPLILGDVRRLPDEIARYRDQLIELITTGTDVYRLVADLPAPPPADAIRLVHISDIHLSPLALPLAKALVERYGADAVLDTGDLVDWGTPAEQALADQIPSLGVPYVYIKGNHDSAGIAAAVARQPNAVVLTADDGPRTVAGLTLAGMADPRFTPDKTTGDDHARHKVGEAARSFAEKLQADGAEVDIALVHAPAAGRHLSGLVPLVLAGDIHRRDVRHFPAAEGRPATTVLVQGSSGGSGLRGVQQDPPTPLMLSVLYLDRSTRRLWGVDEITLGGLGAVEVAVVRRSAADLVGLP